MVVISPHSYYYYYYYYYYFYYYHFYYYYYYYYLLIRVFHISVSWWFSTGVWVTASVLKSPGLFSVIRPFLNNVAVWMVSTRPPISKSFSPFSNPSVTVPNAPITIGIIVTCMFHFFFEFPSLVEVRILLFTFFQFYSLVSRDIKVDNFANSLFLLISIRYGFLAEIRGFVCMSKSHRSLCVLFSTLGAGLSIYHLLVWSKLNFLYISEWKPCPPNHIYSYIPPVLICCIHLLWD